MLRQGNWGLKCAASQDRALKLYPGKGQNPEGEAAEGEAAQAQKRKQGGNSTTVTRQPPTPCETITAGVEQPT